MAGEMRERSKKQEAQSRNNNISPIPPLNKGGRGGVVSDEFKSAYSSALNLLSVCDRSIKELKERLFQKGYTSGSVNKVISKLESEGYINDELYAYKFTYDAVKRKNFGPDLIRQGLKEKGISREITDEAVSRIFKEYNEKDIARKAISKRIGFRGKKLEARSKTQEVRKLSDYLRRRGFSYDIIRDTIKEIEKEYDI